MKYKIEWEEWVYNNNDRIECIKQRKSFYVECDSPLNASNHALRKAGHIIKVIRKRTWKKDYFIPRILSLTDENSKVIRLSRPHVLSKGSIIEKE